MTRRMSLNYELIHKQRDIQMDVNGQEEEQALDNSFMNVAPFMRLVGLIEPMTPFEDLADCLEMFQEPINDSDWKHLSLSSLRDHLESTPPIEIIRPEVSCFGSVASSGLGTANNSFASVVDQPSTTDGDSDFEEFEIEDVF
ncbi:unnamed protein product, partial [Mesorhabditis belari]|uniref:Uncharacterized protein n=1 Tax=Mesorhabditis belari TaxID=2138241 RepID=A0AAF3F1F8_9BILA